MYFKQWEQDGYRLSRKRSEFPFSCWGFSLLHVFLQPPYHIQSIINLQRTTCLLSLEKKESTGVRLIFHVCVSHSLVPVIYKLELRLDGPRNMKLKAKHTSILLSKGEQCNLWTNAYLLEYLYYLLSSCAEFSQCIGQIFGTLAELHGRGLVTNSGHCSLGCSHHLGSRLTVRKRDIMSQNVCSQTHFPKIRTASWKDWGEQSTCRKFWLAPIRASWALGLSGCPWLPLTPCTSWGIWSATTCQVNNSCIRKTSWKNVACALDKC